MAQADSGMMKKETVILIALATFVAGFLGGIVFSAFKSPGSAPQQVASIPPQGGAPGGQQQGFSPEQANRILALEQEVAANPKNADAWTQLGNVWFDTGNFEKAINAYNKSLEIRPGDANVLTDLGVMYRRAGQPNNAVEAFDKAIAADPRHEVSRFNKGIVQYYDLKDGAAAIQTWKDLVKVNPAAKAPNGQLVSDLIADLQAKMGQ